MFLCVQFIPYFGNSFCHRTHNCGWPEDSGIAAEVYPSLTVIAGPRKVSGRLALLPYEYLFLYHSSLSVVSHNAKLYSSRTFNNTSTLNDDHDVYTPCLLHIRND